MAHDDSINVLIVDDREENLLALEHLLETPDLAILKARSGNEALTTVLHNDCALVLLDVQMPDMDGFETAELMRANPNTRSIPIIFVTATSRDEKHVFQGYEAGAVDYITKPIDPMILNSKVQIFCQMHKQRKEIELSHHALEQAHAELSERNNQLQHELELARTVQLGFLPKNLPRTDRIIYGRKYHICSTLGGDLFDVFSIGSRHVGLYLADVAGHGVSAALLSGLLKMAVDSFKEQTVAQNGATSLLKQPDELLRALNGMLFPELPEYRFITVIYAVIDLEDYTCTVSSAGHPHPIHYKDRTQETSVIRIETGPGIGIEERAEYPVNTLQLCESDKIVFYTDGLTEAMDDEYEEFGEEGMLKVFASRGNLAPDKVVSHMLEALDAHRKDRPIGDDFSLLILQLK
ncbi:MAG: fused response regulator/phosphatase [Verrucomicrobia bacterium]|nr:fused response regulator/phosphatase [Verrucomicrobiota bacterium]